MLGTFSVTVANYVLILRNVISQYILFLRDPHHAR